MPGVLPVINKRAVEFALRTALALGCKIAPFCRFARKNYFYPDLPKNYQISQYEQPLAEEGSLAIELNGQNKNIGITRVHLEEDAGKLVHAGAFEAAEQSYVDFNRCGVPLMEIVSEPDIRSPEEAAEYLRTLRTILQYLEVCDGNMEEGSLRCDANVSIRPLGVKELGVKAELKNMNSFRFVQKALEYEVNRQIKTVEKGERILQETRLWDTASGTTISMRSKEEAHDYRYFPEPDLVPLAISPQWIEDVHRHLPELPYERKERLAKQYGLPPYDAGVLTSSKALAEYYEDCVKLYNNPKALSNWIMGDILRELKAVEHEIDECPISSCNLAEMVRLIDEGVISGKIAKTVFEEMWKSKKAPQEIVKEKGLVQITDETALEKAVEEALKQNPSVVEDYRGGKEKALGFLVGAVMKATKGKANPALVNKILLDKLKG
jgi:aspartyl-tRNA(Asn)/glutamyl-tRNA(Gln) amidotransferase subunit B